VDSGFWLEARISVADSIRFEIEEQGNSRGQYVAKQYWKGFEDVPASRLLWVCQVENDCLRYTEEEGAAHPERVTQLDIPSGSLVIGEDNEGGYLVILGA
jgi:hypothetical protein